MRALVVQILSSTMVATGPVACREGGEVGGQEDAGEDEIYELAEVLRATCSRADECSDWNPETMGELEACAIARVVRAEWAECVEPVRRYYDCIHEVVSDCEAYNSSGVRSACDGVAQEAYDLCPKLVRLPL
jgi:hypothetical protein